MNKTDIFLLGGILLLALPFHGYNHQSDVTTLAIQPLANIAVAGSNQTIGELLVSLERRAIGTIGIAKPRQAAPPMPKSYPIRSPPKPSPKPKPKKK